MSLGKLGLLKELLQKAGFVDVAAPFYASSAAQYVDFLRASASPLIETLAAPSSAAQQDAWDDMTERLQVFGKAAGWTGPNELLQCVATGP